MRLEFLSQRASHITDSTAAFPSSRTHPHHSPTLPPSLSLSFSSPLQPGSLRLPIPFLFFFLFLFLVSPLSEPPSPSACMEVPAAHKLQPVPGYHLLQEMVLNPKNQQEPQQQGQEKKARPQPEQALKCPRCASTNTKFCYYNNYSLSQPRYFCKSCRRYWTQGGSLRNVPVGGGCRKNKKSSSSSAAAAASSTKINKSSSDLNNCNNNANLLASSFPPLPSIPHLSDDLTLAFAAGLHKQPHDNGFLLGHNAMNLPSTNPSFLDILRSTTAASSVNDHNLNSIPNAADLSNLYYGSEEGILSFDGDLQARRVQGGHEGSCSKDMEGGGDQTKGVTGLNSWHGLVMNGSSFMGAARMDMSTSSLGDAYTFF